MVTPRTMEHVKGMHDVRHQQSVRHATAQGTVFRRLEQLAQEKERALSRASLWASKLGREEELIAGIDRQTQDLLRTLEPVLRAQMGGASVGGSPSSSGQEDTLQY